MAPQLTCQRKSAVSTTPLSRHSAAFCCKRTCIRSRLSHRIFSLEPRRSSSASPPFLSKAAFIRVAIATVRSWTRLTAASSARASPPMTLRSACSIVRVKDSFNATLAAWAVPTRSRVSTMACVTKRSKSNMVRTAVRPQ